MLIEFKVKNFRSIREEQTLSLVADGGAKELPGSVIDRSIKGVSKLKFLKGAALYGPNASGKSNFILAMKVLRDFVVGSATSVKPGAKTGADAFKLDPASIGEPSEFEVTFVVNEIRYTLFVGMTRERVVEESLVAYTHAQPKKWYHRIFDESKRDGYDWKIARTGFKAPKDLREKTKDNSLFLSVGPQFGHKQLTPVYEWFDTQIHFMKLTAGVSVNHGFTAEMLANADENRKKQIVGFLSGADIGVDGIVVEESEVNLDAIADQLPPRVYRALKEQSETEVLSGHEIKLSHMGDQIASVLFDLNEESDGTKRFFSLIGPWLDILEKGNTVVIDEIETSLHPNLVRELLKLLFSEKWNSKGAQVIFSTHNTVLLDNRLMRRDQIWFTEKTRLGTTKLYPLTDFSPRAEEPREKGYLAGRYGALPFIPEGFKL